MKPLDPRIRALVVGVLVLAVLGWMVYLTASAPSDPPVGESEAASDPSSEPAASTEATSAQPTSTAGLAAAGSGSAGAAAAQSLARNPTGADPADGGTAVPGSSGTDGDGWDGGSISDPKAGLTLAQRQECYWKLIQAEYRAIEEAEAAYPMEVDDADLDAHYAMRFRLTDAYQAEVGATYDLTFDGVVAVLVEGSEGLWPLPPMSE